MAKLINTLPLAKLSRPLVVGKVYLRADGGIVKITEVGGRWSTGKRQMKAVRLCSGKFAGYYSKFGSVCRRASGDAKASRGLNIVGEIVQ